MTYTDEKKATIPRGVISTFRNSILAYSITFATVTTMYFMFWGGIFTVVSSMEKRYSFATWQSGLIIGAAEYGRVATLLPMSYFGSRSHVPRITAISTLFAACDMLLIISPHFIFTQRQNIVQTMNDTQVDDMFSENVCSVTSPINETLLVTTTSENGAHQAYVSNTAFAIFVTAMVLLGIVASPLTNISVAYIDVNSRADKSPLYVGIGNSSLAFGPMVGAFLGAWAVTIFVDLSEPPIGPKHPAWVGAWWIVMAATSVGVILTAPFLFLFPKRMPRRVDNPYVTNDNQGEEMVCMSEVGSENKRVEDVKDEDSMQFPKYAFMDFLRESWRILSNPIFTCLTLTRIPLAIALWGYYGFLAKYVEVQFSAEFSTASIISGVMNLSIALASVGSGIAISFFKLSYRRTAELMTALVLVAMALMIILMFVGCPDVNFSSRNVTDVCAAGCHCDVNDVSPVCDVAEGLTYINPCFAGCGAPALNTSTISYIGCNCTSSGHATPGLCSSCDTLPAYIVLTVLLFIERGFSLSPLISLTMRSVAEADRGLAMGLHIFFIALMGWLPTPVLYGLVIDASCDRWQDLGTTTGYCQIYGRSRYRFNIHGFTAGVLGLQLVFMTASYLFIRRQNFTWDTKTSKPVLELSEFDI